MRTVTYFIADDNKVFEDKDECIAYERRNIWDELLKNGDIIAIDENHEAITNYQDFEDNKGHINFFFFRNNKAVKAMIEYLCDTGEFAFNDSLEAGIIYWYCDDKDDFIAVENCGWFVDLMSGLAVLKNMINVKRD